MPHLVTRSPSPVSPSFEEALEGRDHYIDALGKLGHLLVQCGMPLCDLQQYGSLLALQGGLIALDLHDLRQRLGDVFMPLFVGHGLPAKIIPLSVSADTQRQVCPLESTLGSFPQHPPVRITDLRAAGARSAAWPATHPPQIGSLRLAETAQYSLANASRLNRESAGPAPKSWFLFRFRYSTVLRSGNRSRPSSKLPPQCG